MLLYWATSPPSGGSGEQRLQLGIIPIQDDNCPFVEPAHPGSHGSRRRDQ